jgi:hypothetical protein
MKIFSKNLKKFKLASEFKVLLVHCELTARGGLAIVAMGMLSFKEYVAF